MDRDPDPRSVRNLCKIDLAGNSRADVGTDNAEQDRDDLDHALAPDIADHNDDDRDQSYPPAGLHVVECGRREVKSDGDDDRAGDYRREVLHDLAGSIRFKERGQNKIEKTCARYAEAGVRQQFAGGSVSVKRRDRRVSAKECEGRTQKCGDLLLGDQVEQKCSESCEQQCRGNIEACDQGNYHRRSEHSEHVLKSQYDHFARTQLTRIVDGALADFVLIFTHLHFLLFEKTWERSPIIPSGPHICTCIRIPPCPLKKHVREHYP